MNLARHVVAPWEGAEMLVACADPDGRVVAANPSFCRCFGSTDVPGPQEEGSVATARRAFEQRIGQQARDAASGQAGALFRWDVQGRMLEWGLEPLQGVADACWLVLGQDRTARCLREQRRASADRMQVLAELANHVAHDMNNVLGSTLGFSSYLLSKAEPGSDLHKQLSLIEAAARRGSDMTGQLLAFARQRDERQGCLTVPEVLRQVVQSLADSDAACIHLHMPGEPLPEMAGHVEKMKSLFRHLLINALEAQHDAPLREVEVRVDMKPLDAAERFLLDRPEDDRPYVRVTVSNRGALPEARLLARLCLPYVSTKKQGGGSTGLGLAIAYAVARDHQGFLSHTIEEGRVHATVVLPVRKPQTERAPGVPAVAAPASDTLQGTETILVIDDERIIRNMLGDVLPRFGYRVLCAAGGREGLGLIAGHPGRIDLILLDLNMPELSGEETYEELRVVAPDIPVVVFSGYIVPSIHEKMSRKGVRGFISKPFKNLDLLQQIRRMLDEPGQYG